MRGDALWLHLHLARFPLEVVTRGLASRSRSTAGPGRSSAPAAPPPLVVFEGEGTRAGIVACSERARAVGVTVGMSLGSAWALAAGLTVCKRDAAAEARALREVAAWAMQFSPTVTLCPPAGVVVEVGGSLAYFGGLDALLERVRTGIARLGFSIRAAVAPTAVAASLLASGPPAPPVTERRRLAHALSAVPIEHLGLEHLGPAGLSPASVAALRRLGVRTLGECAMLPRAALGRRVEGVSTLLDRAYGRVPDPRPLFELPSRFETALSFPVPVSDIEALLFGLNRLLQAAAGYLEARAAGATVLALTLRHEPSRADTAIRLRLAAPSRDPTHLLTLSRERLGRISLDAGVETLRLGLAETVALAPRSLELFAGRPGSSDREGLAQLIERLDARLGEHAVRGLGLHADHRPEHAWQPEPAAACVREWLAAPADGIPSPGAPRRPVWLLPEPLPLTLREGQPVLGGALEIDSAPERIESGWWDGGDVSRDYYRARGSHGEQVWIFEDRRHPGAWYLHGIFA